jgi:hypothetical protein
VLPHRRVLEPTELAGQGDHRIGVSNRKGIGAPDLHRRGPGLLRTPGSYHVIDVQLSGGHRVIMTTSRPVEAAPADGDPVEVTFRQVGSVSVPAVAVLPNQGG